MQRLFFIHSIVFSYYTRVKTDILRTPCIQDKSCIAMVPTIFFPRLYGLFMVWSERLSRIRRRPKLAWNPQNVGRTPLSCKDERRFGIKRRLHLTRKREIKLDKCARTFSRLTATNRFRNGTKRRRDISFTRNTTFLVDQRIAFLIYCGIWNRFNIALCDKSTLILAEQS